MIVSDLSNHFLKPISFLLAHALFTSTKEIIPYTHKQICMKLLVRASIFLTGQASLDRLS